MPGFGGFLHPSLRLKAIFTRYPLAGLVAERQQVHGIWITGFRAFLEEAHAFRLVLVHAVAVEIKHTEIPHGFGEAQLCRIAEKTKSLFEVRLGPDPPVVAGA